jgi:hypothetical protein
MGADGAQSERRDLELVGQVADMLQVSEFELFRVAYCQWFGRYLPDRKMEYHFSSYLFHGTLPFWVHHMVRKAAERMRRGELDPAEFSVRLPEGDPDTRALGWFYIVVVALVTFLFCMMVRDFEPY